MKSFKAACIQMRSTRDPARNAAEAEALIRAAAAEGAAYVQTPEMTNLLERSRSDLFAKLRGEEDDPTLVAMRGLAAELGIHLHIGSLAIRLGDEQAANRGFLIGPDGAVLARYDKIHMFDVDLEGGESWRESRTYRPGEASLVIDLPWTRFGLSVCYDVRFPQLYRALAQAGAKVLAVPSSFTARTGAAHWHVLLRARAIENGAFVIAAAQGGRHEDGRETYGHSIVIDPWGRVIAEKADDEPGYILAEIDPAVSDKVRAGIPSLTHDRAFAAPAEPARPSLETASS